jgi:hypothetical protein
MRTRRMHTSHWMLRARHFWYGFSAWFLQATKPKDETFRETFKARVKVETKNENQVLSFALVNAVPFLTDANITDWGLCKVVHFQPRLGNRSDLSNSKSFIGIGHHWLYWDNGRLEIL